MSCAGMSATMSLAFEDDMLAYLSSRWTVQAFIDSLPSLFRLWLLKNITTQEYHYLSCVVNRVGLHYSAFTYSFSVFPKLSLVPPTQKN